MATEAILEPTTLAIEGMTCSSCVNAVEKALNNMDGVRATINFATETAHVLAPADMDIKELIKTVEKAGYKASLLQDAQAVTLHSKKSARALFFAFIFAVPAVAISMVMSWHHAIDMWIHDQLDVLGLPHPLYSATAWLVIALSAPVVLMVAWPIHRAALRNLKHPTMDNLISMGSIAAFTWSIYANSTGEGDVYTEVAAGVIFFVILGRFLETRAKARAGAALSSLLALGSKEVTIVRGGFPLIVPIEQLQIGDEFEVRPGDRVATDGIVVSGQSSVDNSMLTGESKPVDVAPGSQVIGASVNHNGRLIVRATRVGSDTELARITAMVISAQGTKAPIQRLADRISAVFVPIVTLLSIGTFTTWYLRGYSLTQSISVAITVLVIACPCALGLATPVALLVASGRGAQRGIVLREPRVLEIARNVDTVVFDKTGTLTEGVMNVQNATISAAAGAVLGSSFASLINEATILSSANAIESANSHPVALAISRYALGAGAKNHAVTDFSVTPGSGAAGRVNLGTQSPVVLIGSPAAVAHSCTDFHPEIKAAVTAGQNAGLTVCVLAWDGVALAVFAVGDQLKSDAAETITNLKSMGITPWLVTGDSSEVAAAVALTVGIDNEHVVSAAMPETKLVIVEKLKAQGHCVLMIGDGINDAAALTAADLSMAMGTGTDTAISSADITLMNSGLGSVISALKLSQKSLRIIRLNMGWALIYNVIGLPIAAFGLLTPIYAAGAMALSSLFVVTNSLRIK
ncbi:MAG: heavy metal translocating P-type ATPase [Actinobacteria bacterium]|nr:heavy metal translocating P-type ATPase [Actinomycetota bacterium]NCX15569.1 heavy metal translocating P-type ATPase [Actinomycetota bacterium]NCX37063.1 heavy metal translocating P-type ATPase [Actinomycetota bacterium]